MQSQISDEKTKPAIQETFERCMRLAEAPHDNVKENQPGFDQTPPSEAAPARAPTRDPINKAKFCSDPRGRDCDHPGAHVPFNSRRYRCDVPWGRYIIKWNKDDKVSSCQLKEELLWPVQLNLQAGTPRQGQLPTSSGVNHRRRPPGGGGRIGDLAGVRAHVHDSWILAH